MLLNTDSEQFTPIHVKHALVAHLCGIVVIVGFIHEMLNFRKFKCLSIRPCSRFVSQDDGAGSIFVPEIDNCFIFMVRMSSKYVCIGSFESERIKQSSEKVWIVAHRTCNDMCNIVREHNLRAYANQQDIPSRQACLERNSKTTHQCVEDRTFLLQRIANDVLHRRVAFNVCIDVGLETTTA